jgi:branched-chain amino acid transport system permease protein
LDWFFQQLINGLALGSIYALIALGYTMVYGILRFINFAHSDVLMLGAFAAFFVAPQIAHLFPLPSYVGALLVTALAAGICAAIGILIEMLAYRPLRDRPKLTVLITAIGVSLFIEFSCQQRTVLPFGQSSLTLGFGSDTKPFPKLLPQHDFHLGGLVVNSTDIVVPLVTLLLLAALWLVVQKTKIGTAMRAVSFNHQAAALMGVSINRVISFTFGLGSALAAIAGILYALKAPGIEPLMGVQPGLRAFIAAVLGGIGNLPGAALGGLVLGLLETFAGGMPAISNYRDGIAFAILILILLFRPAGLLGKAQVEKV